LDVKVISTVALIFLMSTAPTARADPASNTDQQFVLNLAAKGIHVNRTATEIGDSGRGICVSIYKLGVTVGQIRLNLLRDNDNLSQRNADILVGEAVNLYCPAGSIQFDRNGDAMLPYA
jgi:hypothetical protein